MRLSFFLRFFHVFFVRRRRSYFGSSLSLGYYIQSTIAIIIQSYKAYSIQTNALIKQNRLILFPGIPVSLLLAYGISLNSFNALIITLGAIVAALIITDLKWGLIFSLLIPIFGQFLRFRLQFGGGIMALDLVVFLTLFVFLIKQLTVYKNRKFDASGWAMIFFLIIALISLIIGVANLSFGALARSGLYWGRLVAYFGLYFVAYQEIKTKQDRNMIVGILFLAGIALCLSGFYQLLYYPDFLHLKLYELGWDPHINRLTSTWLDPNFFGGYLVVLLMLTVSFGIRAFEEKRIVRLAFFVALFALFFVTLFYTLSRSSYLAFLMGISVIGLIRARKLLIIAFIIGIIALGSSQRIQERVNNGIMSFQALFTDSTLSLDPTAKLRVKSWNEGFAIWRDNPFLGVGYNTLRYENERRGYAELRKNSSSGFDSSIITILATTGIAGGIAFLFFLITILHKHANAYIKQKDFFSLAILASLAALFVHSFFVNSLLFPFILTTMLILWGSRSSYAKA